MLERIISFLKELPGGQAGAADGTDDEPRVAAAALMYHVMDADGVRQDAEWERMKALLSQSYGLSGTALERLVAAGAEAEQEAIDLYALCGTIKRHLDEKARIEFIRLMWDIVYADGELHELEDNTMWRIAELIGVDRGEPLAGRRERTGGVGDPAGE